MIKPKMRTILRHARQFFRQRARPGSRYMPPYSSPGWSMETIPIKVVFCVTAYLPPESHAALALTSRTMLSRLGNRCLKLEPSSRYNFLLLLSKDGMYLPDILCPFCRVFHTPSPQFLVAMWREDGHQDYKDVRECASRDWVRGPPVASPYLPAHVDFNIIAAVMSCHRHKFPAFGPETLASNGKAFNEGCRFHIDYNFRVMGGQLIMKTEKLILPGMGKEGGILDGVREVAKVLGAQPWRLGKCCAHINWLDQYPYVFTGARCRWCHKYIWTHRLSFSGCVCVLRSKARFEIGICRFCHTDYSLGFVDLPHGRGRLCVMTSWKALGPGISPVDEWQSHLYSRPRTSHRNRLEARAYRAFEGERGSRYKPSISQRRLDDLLK